VWNWIRQQPNQVLHADDVEEALLTPKNSPESPAVGDAIGYPVSKILEIKVAEQTEATDTVDQVLHHVRKRPAWMQHCEVIRVHQSEDTTYFALLAYCDL